MYKNISCRSQWTHTVPIKTQDCHILIISYDDNMHYICITQQTLKMSSASVVYVLCWTYNDNIVARASIKNLLDTVFPFYRRDVPSQK